MYAQTFSQIISKIHSKQVKQSAFHPATTLLSVKYADFCSTCEVLKGAVDDLHAQQMHLSSQYNELLDLVEQLTEVTVGLLKENQQECEQLSREIREKEADERDRQSELKEELSEKNRIIYELQTQLMERENEISMMEDRKANDSHDRSFFRKQSIDLQGRCEALSTHKRQKSQQCTRLETLNSTLLEQNARLAYEVNQLRDYMRRMEEDLACNNIRSPRLINEVNEYIQNDSIEEESSISGEESEMSIDRRCMNERSLTSSFGGTHRMLKEILNITNQSGNCFQFQTLERADMRQRSFGDSSNENDFNSVNVMGKIGDEKGENLQEGFNIKEIKEFQVEPEREADRWVEKSIERSLLKKKEATPQKLTQNRQLIPLNVDPYYAFFTLTIQCIKLNWGNLNDVANIDLTPEWGELVSSVPFNKWEAHLRNKMHALSGAKV